MRAGSPRFICARRYKRYNMKIATFNLRTDAPVDGGNRWQCRKGLVLDRLMAERPDVVGFQEATPEMAGFLRRHMQGYICVGNGRERDLTGENNMIAFRQDAFELIALDTFWLSDTPDVPGSRYANQSEYPRICTHAMLRRLGDGAQFHAYNTHLDHVSDEARVLGARAILRRIASDLECHPLPLALTGDMNAAPDSPPLRALLGDARVRLTNQTPNFPASYHAYGARPDLPQIDYVLTQGFRAVGAPVAWTRAECGLYLSDHSALCASVEPCADGADA